MDWSHASDTLTLTPPAATNTTSDTDHPETDAETTWVDVSPIKFDRRHESRIPTSGFAQLICTDPFKTFLGGTAELVDVSRTGMAVFAPNAITPGECVEVRLSPFRVRGRVGRVVRCDPVAVPTESGSTVVRYRVAFEYAHTRAA